MPDFRNIRAWQKADDLAVIIYQLTKSFPKSEMYGLTSQIRRAAVSVAANIAEGSARASERDYLHFLFIAKSSLVEAEYYLHLSHRLGYLDDGTYERVTQIQRETGKVLQGLIRHIQDRLKS